MANYFQLLCGLHSEHGTPYTAGDVVKSEGNLVAAFGSNKFRKLSDKEIAALEKKDETTTDAPVKRKRVKAKRKSA